MPVGREVLSEELGLQKLLEGREGRPCSGSARQLTRRAQHSGVVLLFIL